MPVQNATTDYWDINGTSLSTYAYNVTELGSKFGTPALRGTDVEQAYRPGAAFRPKVAASQTVTLAMWVIGSDPNTSTSGGTADPRKTVKTNLRMLEKLFYSPRTQLSVTKRWTDDSGSYAVTGKAQVTGVITPEFTGAQRAAFVVDLFFADPFYYGTQVTQALALSTPVTLTNPGDDSSPSNLTVNFIGPLTDPVLTNSTPNPDVWCKFTGSVPTGETAILDILAPRATLPGFVVSSSITNGGSLWWMEIFPGANVLTLTAAAGTGTASVVYKPAFF